MSTVFDNGLFSVEAITHYASATDYYLMKKYQPIDPLEGSIKKWESIVAFLESLDDKEIKFHDGGTGTCYLCRSYYEYSCEGCPVKMDGHPYCEGTPYYDFIEESTVSGMLDCAKDELEYLRLLEY